MNQAIEMLRSNRDQALAELIELVRIPSISPGLPHPEAITEAADWLERRLERSGMDEVRALFPVGILRLRDPPGRSAQDDYWGFLQEAQLKRPHPSTFVRMSSI